MHAVIAVFYGLFTWMLMVVYAVIARPDLVGLALVLGPFIASGMTLALLLLDAIVAGWKWLPVVIAHQQGEKKAPREAGQKGPSGRNQ